MAAKNMICSYGDFCWNDKGVGCDHAYAHAEDRMCHKHECWMQHKNPKCKRTTVATDWMSEKI